MSVIGFDVGNESCVIAAAKQCGIDVLLNDEAKRDTPAVVSFGDKQRFFGSAGAAFATSKPKSTISQIKRLIGRLYNEPSVQKDLKLLPFVTSEGPRGGIVVELEYLKEKWNFTPVEILGMLFTHLKKVAEKNLDSPVVNCVIGIPSYFTDLQRREYLDAARISGLRPLRLMHDGTAIALGYGMYKTNFSMSGPNNVIFFDMGHCDTQVTVAAFEQGGMKILSHSFDPNLGGRDFDEVLFRHFSGQFKEKYKIDVYSNVRASIRLRASCEKVKRVLSSNAQAPISIECLIDDTDVRGVIKREEFEKLSQELLERVRVSCIKAVEDSGINADKIYTIELVGSGSRIPAITKVLSSFFNREPTRTLHANECVARGCALRCAMLSPSVKVRDYKVEDVFPYSIEIPLDEVKNKTHVLFNKGSAFPNYKMVVTTGSIFYFDVSYTKNKDFPGGVSTKVGNFKIGSSETADLEKPKVEFNMKLNHHGIVEIESALVLEDDHYGHWTFQSYQWKSVEPGHTSNLEFSENLDVATTEYELHEAQKRKQKLAEQDKKVEETTDQRNTLESFVYDTRSKLSSDYRNLASDTEKKIITDSLQKTEDWLYEENDDESEQDYSGKLHDLKKLLDPVENKFKEEKERARVTEYLQTCIENKRLFAYSSPRGLKEKILNECSRVEQWLNNLSFQQPHPNQIYMIEETTQTFDRCCNEITRYKSNYLVNSDQRDQFMKSEDLHHLGHFTDSNERGPCLNFDQKDCFVNSDQKSQPGYSSQNLRPADSALIVQPIKSVRNVQPSNSMALKGESSNSYWSFIKPWITKPSKDRDQYANSSASKDRYANSSTSKDQYANSSASKKQFKGQYGNSSTSKDRSKDRYGNSSVLKNQSKCQYANSSTSEDQFANSSASEDQFANSSTWNGQSKDRYANSSTWKGQSGESTQKDQPGVSARKRYHAEPVQKDQLPY